MAELPDPPKPERWTFDPRRSLVAGAMWLIITLVLALSMVAAVSVGSIARETVFEQHVRRLQLETDQLGTDLGLAIATRMDAVRAVCLLLNACGSAAAGAGPREIFEALRDIYPDLDWLAAADAEGRVVASNGALDPGKDARTDPWFVAGSVGPWLGVVGQGAGSAPVPVASGRPSVVGTVATALGDLALPVRDAHGRLLGVVAARAAWRRPREHFTRLTDETDPEMITEALVLDRDGRVLVGPPSARGARWRDAREWHSDPFPAQAPQFERLADGRKLLVSRAVIGGGDEVARLGWQVQLGEPESHVYRRADSLALRIFWISLALGAVTALLGVQGARQLTARLRRLMTSVSHVAQDDTAPLEVAGGTDEVAQLGAAFARILAALQEERRELERRVAVRTRELERLAEESRYASIVRERLKIARDLHDTLAHSMMAMLSEVRLLRRLQARDPDSLAEELQRAEEVAREGLSEARKAITQMRSTTVRETGLGPALELAITHFADRTGLTGQLAADPEAARFGDERGETFLRIAQEALRNVELHAQATRVVVRLAMVEGRRLVLRITDDGIGFDPARIPSGHYGLIGLREQAELIGADLQIETAPGQGTTITLAVNPGPIAFPAGS